MEVGKGGELKSRKKDVERKSEIYPGSEGQAFGRLRASMDKDMAMFWDVDGIIVITTG